MAVVLQGQWEEAAAVVLEELLQQELRGCRQERVLAVRGADVLGRHDGHGVVRHLRGEDESRPLLATLGREVLPKASRLHGIPAGWPCHGGLCLRAVLGVENTHFNKALC